MERAALHSLVDAMDADSPADAIRRLLDSFQHTAVGRRAMPLLAEHGRAAAVEAERRVHHLRHDAVVKEVEAGSLWSGDPGVRVDTSGIDPSLPLPDARAVRGGLARALGAERNEWASPYRGVRGAVKALARRARHARVEALKDALKGDGIGGVVLGWRSPEDAKRVLGVDTMPVPFHASRNPAARLPIAVAIGAGADVLEAHRSAAQAGYGRDVQDAAHVLMAPAAVLEIVRRRLEPGGFVDFNALLKHVKDGEPEAPEEPGAGVEPEAED